MSSSSEVPKRPLLLCIDDADTALRVKKLLLDNAGYEVVTAQSAEDGLELFKQHQVELVIADHFLSAKTGTEIAREMKQLKPEVPILIVSAGADEPEGIEFADGFLAKCEPAEVLIATLARMLAASSPRKRASLP